MERRPPNVPFGLRETNKGRGEPAQASRGHMLSERAWGRHPGQRTPCGHTEHEDPVCSRSMRVCAGTGVDGWALSGKSEATAGRPEAPHVPREVSRAGGDPGAPEPMGHVAFPVLGSFAHTPRAGRRLPPAAPPANTDSRRCLEPGSLGEDCCRPPHHGRLSWALSWRGLRKAAARRRSAWRPSAWMLARTRGTGPATQPAAAGIPSTPASTSQKTSEKVRG